MLDASRPTGASRHYPQHLLAVRVQPHGDTCPTYLTESGETGSIRRESRSSSQTDTSTSLSLRERARNRYVTIPFHCWGEGLSRGKQIVHCERLPKRDDNTIESSKGALYPMNSHSTPAQTPHPDRRKVLLTHRSDPLPEGEGGGRARFPGKRAEVAPTPWALVSGKLY